MSAENNTKSASWWNVLNNSPILKGLAVAIIIIFCLVGPIAVVVSRLDHTGSEMALCINHLRFIQNAKQVWALDKKAPTNAMPTWDDLKPYMPSRMTTLPPKCLSGGVYTIGNLQTAPTCTVKGHVLK